MREIKFQFLYKGLPFHSGTEDCNRHKKVYSLDQLIEKKLSDLSDVHGISTLIAKRQFTGLTDKNGVEIYEGDIVQCYPDDMNLTYFKEVKWARGRPELSITADSSGLILCTRTTDLIEVAGNIYENPDLIGDL